MSDHGGWRAADDADPDGFRGRPQTRCVAHRKNGDQCKRHAIKGATVCRVHGGAAGHVRRKAKQRLDEAADRMAKELLGIATSGDVSDAVKLAAIRDALDRSLGRAPATVDVSVSAPKPWEEMVSGMATVSRAESRAARGLPDDTPRAITVAPPPWEESAGHGPAPEPDGPLDVEVVEAPGMGLMTMEEANEVLAWAKSPRR